MHRLYIRYFISCQLIFTAYLDASKYKTDGKARIACTNIYKCTKCKSMILWVICIFQNENIAACIWICLLINDKLRRFKNDNWPKIAEEKYIWHKAMHQTFSFGNEMSSSPCYKFIYRSYVSTQIAKFKGPTWGPPGSCIWQIFKYQWHLRIHHILCVPVLNVDIFL